MKTGAKLAVSSMLLAIANMVGSAEVDIPNTFVSGEAAVAADVNENFSALETAVDDNHARVAALEVLHPDDLTQIQYLNWQHNGEIEVTDYLNNGLVVWFSNNVLSDSLLPPSYNYHVQLFKLSTDWELEFDIDINEVSAVDVDPDAMITGFTVEADPVSETVQGMQIIRINVMDPMDTLGTYRLVIRGDFVTDVNDRALDGNFLGGETPTGDRVEGGTFETIFRVVL